MQITNGNNVNYVNNVNNVILIILINYIKLKRFIELNKSDNIIHKQLSLGVP